ncbi:MAG: hypothetical protein HY398_00810 [Candidatus Doudnabacteria bacterium]|nr:hypothetical protein [Candidatus Doudnabacteria bacterium]
MHKPNRSFAKKVFAAGLAVTTALWAFSGLFAVVSVSADTEAHPDGTLVLSGGTVWQISGTQRMGVDSLAKFQSHRFSFGNVVPANSADLALTDGGLLGWGAGVLFNDGGTVYQVSGGVKRGFTSAAVFTGLGFKFSQVVAGSLAGVTAGANIESATGAHQEGTFVVDSSSTVWMITATGRKGVPSPGVLYSYGATFSDVVSANSADLALANEGNAMFRTGALVNDAGTIFAVTATTKRGFPTASCFTGFGFSFSNVVTGATSGLTAGVNFCTSTTTTTPTTPTTPTSSGTLTVSLASDTPAAGTAIKSAARVPFTKVNLTATGGDVVVDSWVVKRAGVAQDSSFASVDIIDLSTNASINDAGKTFGTDHTASFTEDLTVKSGTTASAMLAGNIAASPGSGEQPILQLLSMTLKGGTLSGTFPISGNAMTINTSITIGTATVQRGAYVNASSTTIEVGKTAYTFFSFQIQAGSTESLTFSQVKVYQSGSASLTADLANIKLYRDGTFLANGTISGNYVNFQLSNETITKGQTNQYLVKADVIGGSARTVKLGIWRNTDIYVVGQTYNSGITPTYSGTGSGSGQNVLQDNQFTISTGTLRVGQSSTVSASNITIGSNQLLGAFEFEVKGEPVIVTALTLTVVSSTGAQIEDAGQAFRIVDKDGNTVAGPTDITNNALTVAFSDTFTAPVGVNHYKVYATLSTNGGWATNDTIYVTINTPASAITAKGEVTGQTVSPTPSANTAATTQTVKAAGLTITKNSTPTDKTVITNSNNVLLGSWQFDGSNSGEDIRVTSIAVRASTTGKFNTLTMKKTSSPGGTVLTTMSPVNDNPVSSNNANTTSTFALSDPLVITKGTSANIDLYGNVGSNAVAGEVDAWGLTDTTSATNASVVAYGVTTGNRATVTLTSNNGALLTIAAAGTLTINVDSSAPSSRLVVHGSTGVTLAEVRLKATSESIDVTRLIVGITDGGLTGTAAGTFAQVKKFYLKLDGTVVGNADGYSPGAQRTTINFERGQLTVPEGTTGKKMSILGDIVNLGTNEPGTANADIRAGIDGADNLTAYGNGSNSSSITKTYNDSTGTAVILHKAVPSVSIAAVSNNKLGATAILHETKISAVGNTIGLYRLAYSITSSTGVRVTNLYTKLTSCTGCGGVSDGSQLAATSSTAGYLIDGENYVVQTIDQTQSHGKYHLQIAAGATATIDLYGSVVLTTNSDTISTRLLGDTASTMANDTGGATADAFNELNQGNFVWSDLNLSDANTANTTATDSTTSKQWYNGYYVAGLGSTTSSTPQTYGE